MRRMLRQEEPARSFRYRAGSGAWGRRSWLLLVALSLGTGCGDSEARTSVDIFGKPLALDEHAVWIDRASNQALVMDVSRSRPRPEVDAFAVPSNPVVFQRRNRHNELLVLARGEAAGDGVLVALGPRGVERRFPLGSRFDTLLQSDDGRYAFVGFAPDRRDDPESLLFNPNEVAIVDLDEGGADAVYRRSLRGLGSAPRSAAFSPEMDLGGEKRRVAVVLFDSHVSLVDLNHPDRPEYTVELSRGASIELNQVRFSAEQRRIYLLGGNSNDIYVLTLLPASANRVNDFEPSLNQLGASSRPSDMVLYGEEDERRLLAVSGSKALVIEAGSNRITEVALQASANRILLFEGTSPFDDEVEPRALLYQQGGSTVSFLNLVGVEERTTRNVELLPISGGIESVIGLEDNRVVILRQGGVSLLDLESRSASELSTAVNFSSTVTSPELQRLWIRPDGYSALAYLDFDEQRSTPGQVSLDEPAQHLLLFTNGDRPRVGVTHEDAGGAVTLLDARRPDDLDRAVTLRGFFYTYLLDRWAKPCSECPPNCARSGSACSSVS